MNRTTSTNSKPSRERKKKGTTIYYALLGHENKQHDQRRPYQDRQPKIRITTSVSTPLAQNSKSKNTATILTTDPTKVLTTDTTTILTNNWNILQLKSYPYFKEECFQNT